MFSFREMAEHAEGALRNPSHPRVPTGICVDSRRVLPGDVFIALPGARTDGHAFLEEAFSAGAAGAVIRMVPDRSRHYPNLVEVSDPLAALQRMAAAWRGRFHAPMVAITGSNGKTTTKGLLAHLLAEDRRIHAAPENYNTEIGLPLALLTMPEGTDAGIFELGTQAPGEIAFLAKLLQPSIAVLTSVGPSHLDGLRSLDAVADEKWSLVDALPCDGLVLFNADCPALRRRASGTPRRRCGVGISQGDLRAVVKRTCPLDLTVAEPAMRLRPPLLGAHHAANVLLAACCALHLGMEPAEIERRMTAFAPPPHRLSPLQVGASVVLDDTYNANPASSLAALNVARAYGGANLRRIYVFGAMLGLGERAHAYHRQVLAHALRIGIDEIIPVGEASETVCRETADSCISWVDREALGAYLAERMCAAPHLILLKGSRDLHLDEVVASLRPGRSER